MTYRRSTEPPTWKTRNAIPEGFNTALVIWKAMQKTGVTQAEIARKTGRSPSTVKNLRRGRSIQSSILHELSIAIGADLFRPLSDNLPAEIRSSPDAATIAALHTDKLALQTDKLVLQQQIDELKAQLAQLREDNGYLKKMIDIIAAKK